MKSSLVTIFSVFSFFVLSGCGGDDKKSQTPAVYDLLDVKVGSECTQIEKNLLDWDGWEQGDPSQLGNDPAGAGANCVQIDVDETDQAAVTTLNEEVNEFDQARTESETLCKWGTSSGNNWICKPSSDLTQIKSDFASHYSLLTNKSRWCVTAKRKAAINAISGGTDPSEATQNCAMMTSETSYGGSNVEIVITDEKFNEHVNTARSANESLCFWRTNIHRITLNHYLCRVQ